MINNFPNIEEQCTAIRENFKNAGDLRILAYARQFASATVYADGDTYDVGIYRNAQGEAAVSDVFNTRFDIGE